MSAILVRAINKKRTISNTVKYYYTITISSSPKDKNNLNRLLVI